ncbi:sensor histidine kinase [Flagellimonas lutimaris]|uniref:sensor histidine kinase n=1 Tax=Flagellimonas lutimaris TaxID=475082 RepID=UPI003F5CE620
MKKYLDIKLIKILSLFYAIIVFITFIKRLYFVFSRPRDGGFNWFDLIFSRTILDWILVMLFMILVTIITKKMIVANTKPVIIVLVHLILSFVIDWFIFLFAAVVLYLMGRTTIVNGIKGLSLDHFMFSIDYYFTAYFVMAGIIHIYYYLERVKNVEMQKALLSNQLTISKMNTLKSQLHPHFLFNTLNTISSLISSNTKQAQNTLADLSDLLRAILDLKTDNLITVEQEIKLLKKYLDIIQIRFSDHLTIKMDVKRETHDALIPSMLLQPIVENTFKHGFSYHNTNLVLHICIFKNKESLIVEIMNNGKPIEESYNMKNSSGKGISNVIERLKTLFGSNFQFSFKNLKEEKGVVTKIVTPFKIAESIIYEPLNSDL